MSQEHVPSDTAQAAAPPTTASRHVKDCANCGAPMHGPFCYACGQPEKGMIRHLASVLSDIADTIFNVDSRIFRSIPPLYFRPGFLTLEYFAGRRTRYVTPFRLFFFLCVISFFAIQIALNVSDTTFNLIGAGSTEGIRGAMTEAELDKRMEAALKNIVEARDAPDMPAAAAKALDSAAEGVRKQAEERRAWLKKREAAEAKGQPLPPDPSTEDMQLSFNNQPWDPEANPIAIAWLPAFANAKLNEMALRAKENLKAAGRDPRHLIAGIFSVAPWTLGLMMPLFAVLLKIVYIFKRRLYMEHLMVALHSHAFIFMSLLLLALISLAGEWADKAAPDATPLLNLLRAAVWTWLPIYLFLMQKKVYRQGWFMTTFKYALVGFSYIFILAFAFAAAFLATLTQA